MATDAAEQLGKAIYTKATTAGNFNTAISGQYYKAKALEDITGTYCVMHHITQVHDLWLGDESFEDFEVQFNLYDDTPNSDLTILTASEYLFTLFDACVLTVTGWTFHAMIRNLTIGPDWFPDERLWQMVITYLVKLEK